MMDRMGNTPTDTETHISFYFSMLSNGLIFDRKARIKAAFWAATLVSRNEKTDFLEHSPKN